MKSFDFCASALRTIELEAQAVSLLSQSVSEAFMNACQLVLHCQGRVIVTGMGKSGHIGNKIAATLASTGTPAFFVHPGEASHGDMGMITDNDVVIALSNSGEVQEVLALIPLLQRLSVPLVSITSQPNSTLALASDAHLNTLVTIEACPLNLAPTSSTTATLVLGDALAIALLEARGFTSEDFAFSHPGGSLGKKLLLRVQQLMTDGQDIPCISDQASLSCALLEMSQKGKGMTCIVNSQQQLVGIFTDGDLRRAIKDNINLNDCPIIDVMTPQPLSIEPNMLAAQALFLMEQKNITSLVCTDQNKQVLGVIHLHDLIKAGLA